MAKESNKDIRLAAAGAGIHLWQIAQALGVTDSTFSRMLRVELTPADKQRIAAIISSLSNGGGEDEQDE